METFDTANMDALLLAEEKTCSNRIGQINWQIADLLRQRREQEQHMHHVIDVIIAHGEMIVEVPGMRNGSL